MAPEPVKQVIEQVLRPRSQAQSRSARGPSLRTRGLLRSAAKSAVPKKKTVLVVNSIQPGSVEITSPLKKKERARRRG